MQYTLNLAAGVRQTTEVRGKLLAVLSTGTASSVVLTVWRGSNPIEELQTAQRGFKARMVDGGQFTRLDVTAPTACTVVLYVSDGSVDFDFVGTASSPIPVSNDRGSPGLPMTVTGVTINDAPATSVTNNAAVAVTSAGAAIVGAASTRREMRVSNLGPDQVAIGAPGVTWAARCIVLAPGDMWVESRGANLAWSAITNAGTSASVTVQEVLG
jgi:hypothetical protein